MGVIDWLHGLAVLSGKNFQYPLSRRSDGPQGRYGRFGEKKKIS